MSNTRFPLWLKACILVVSLLAAGCSSSSEDVASSAESFPVLVESAAGPITVPAKPVRVVSLSPSATETLFAIGAGSQVVAVDDQSTFPAEAPKTALSGFTPNVEAIAGYKPDLLVLSNDTNGLVASMQRLNIPTLLQTAPKNLDEMYKQVRDLGTATGNTDAANATALRVENEIEALAAAADTTKKLKVYHEVDNTLYSLTSTTFVGQIYSRFGFTNIADAADKDGAGYPQLSAEYLLQANPDVIFLADTKCCGQSLQTVAARPGFAGVTAVRNGNVIALDDDVASRWGPRIVEVVKVIADARSKAQAA